MLIEQHRVPVGIGQHEARGAFRRFVGLGLELQPARLQLPLDVTPANQANRRESRNRKKAQPKGSSRVFA
jgi:hypothetical protein